MASMIQGQRKNCKVVIAHGSSVFDSFLSFSLTRSFPPTLPLSLSPSSCHRFSAVVRRQEMATPPLTDTTPIRYNRGTPSVSNENRNVAPPPPAAATVGTNSIPKTDTSSADDSSRYKNELLSSSQPAVPSVSSSGLGSTKTFTAIEDGESADSAIKGHTVRTCRESEEATSDKVSFSVA